MQGIRRLSPSIPLWLAFRKRLFEALSKQTYLKLLPYQNPNTKEYRQLLSFFNELWERELRSTFLRFLLMALAAALFSRMGFSLNRGFYLIRLLFYAVRGQALLALYRNADSTPMRKHHFPSLPTYPLSVDYIVIGSGAAGATVAKTLAEQGKEVLILEEGSHYQAAEFQSSVYSATQTLFRNQGMQFARGKSLIPVMQGRCVGGTTVINGAIIHPLPESIFQSWSERFGIDQAFSWNDLTRVSETILRELNVRANLSGELPNLPINKTLNSLNWAHQAMLRNAPHCQGSGRCLQGCPTGGKLSMERSFIPAAVANGAFLAPDHKVEQILFDGQRATGVVSHFQGTRKKIGARKAVILAAGAIHTPWLLHQSGVRNPQLGKHFQCHLGVNSIAKLPTATMEIEGMPQGIEVTEFELEGTKLATQLLPPELMLCRTPLEGDRLISELAQLDRYTAWTASIRSQAEGSIRFHYAPRIDFEPTADDLKLVAKSLARLEILFQNLGADAIYPGQMTKIPFKDSRSYFLGIGHLFGTCRMGREPSMTVVNTRFQVHGYAGLYCVDASLFPTNIGVNPQHAIMCLAKIAGEQIAVGRG